MIGQRALAFYNQDYGRAIRQNGLVPTVPDKEVVTAVERLQGGKALDIGCGLGRNCLYMARNGFQVKAVDLSEVAVQYVQQLANAEHLSVAVSRTNILTEPLDSDYNLVNASYVLDEFDYSKVTWLVRRMQDATVSGGINTIVVCGKGTQRKDRFPFKNHFFTEQELVNLYENAGWHVLSRRTTREPMYSQLLPMIRLILQK